MKKFYLLIFVIFMMVATMQSQPFAFNPTDNYEANIQFNTYTEHQVYMDNLTVGTLALAWERVFIDFPLEWTVTTCDNGGCYTGIPPSGTMLPYDTLTGFLRLTVNAYDTPGTGIAIFNVYDTKDPDQSDTLTFVIHAGETTGINGNFTGTGINVYPNPCRENVHVEFGNAKPDLLILTNLLGQEIIRENTTDKKEASYQTGDLDKGVYFITLTTGNSVIDRKKLLIN